jgi:hypothetical protein
LHFKLQGKQYGFYLCFFNSHNKTLGARRGEGGGGWYLDVHFVVYPKNYLFIFLKQDLFHQIHVASKIVFAMVQNLYQRWINEHTYMGEIWYKIYLCNLIYIHPLLVGLHYKMAFVLQHEHGWSNCTKTNVASLHVFSKYFKAFIKVLNKRRKMQ